MPPTIGAAIGFITSELMPDSTLPAYENPTEVLRQLRLGHGRLAALVLRPKSPLEVGRSVFRLWRRKLLPSHDHLQLIGVREIRSPSEVDMTANMTTHLHHGRLTIHHAVRPCPLCRRRAIPSHKGT